MNKNKNSFLYIALLGIFSLTVGGCKKFLDEQPISQISQETFWRTPEDLAFGVAAMYDGLQGALNGTFIEWGDARSDNFTNSGTGDVQINISINNLNSLIASSSWANIYTCIARCNLVLENVGNIPGISAIQRDDIISQALTVRAYMYYYLVRVWGDAPVRNVTYKSLNENSFIPRSPKDSILQSIIIPDLERATTLSDRTVTNAYRVNIGAIFALLTDVYMWVKNYDLAIARSASFTALSYRYDVSANTSNAMREIFVNPINNREAVWFVDWSWERDGQHQMSRVGSSGNTSQFSIDSALLDRFQQNRTDIRRFLNYDTLRAFQGLEVDRVWKYYAIDPVTNLPAVPIPAQNQAKLPLIRTSDVLLLRAEALNRTNRKTEAFTILNRIRTLRGLPTYNAANFNDVVEIEKLILDERQLELYAEGKRWFDLMRTGRVLEVMNPVLIRRQRRFNIPQIGFGDERRIYWPVSRLILIRNPALTQNPPYSD